MAITPLRLPLPIHPHPRNPLLIPPPIFAHINGRGWPSQFLKKFPEKIFTFQNTPPSNFHSFFSTHYYIVYPILNDPHLYFLQRLIQKNSRKIFISGK